MRQPLSRARLLLGLSESNRQNEISVAGPDDREQPTSKSHGLLGLGPAPREELGRDLSLMGEAVVLTQFCPARRFLPPSPQLASDVAFGVPGEGRRDPVDPSQIRATYDGRKAVRDGCDDLVGLEQEITKAVAIETIESPPQPEPGNRPSQFAPLGATLNGFVRVGRMPSPSR